MNLLLRCFFVVLACSTTVFATTPSQSSISMIGRGYILNAGQWPANVVAVAKQQNMNVWVTRSGMVFDHFKTVDGTRTGAVISASWQTQPATQAVRVESSTQGFPVTFHTAQGTFQTRCVPTLEVKNIGEGVHADFEMDNGRVRYNFDIERVQTTTPISIVFDGKTATTMNNTSITIQGENNLGITMDELLVTSKATNVNAKFISSDNSTVGIVVPTAAVGKSVRIDPIVYGTYLGSGGDDKVVGVEILNAQVVAYAGTTDGLDFPEGTGGYAKSTKGGKDAFVAFMNPKLSEYVGFTFFGGTQDDVAKATTKDSQGNLILVGETTSQDMPITQAVAGQTPKGAYDVFIVKFNPLGTTLQFSTYLGGNKDDNPMAATVDFADNIYVVGKTASNNSFPTNGGFQKTFGGLIDCFMTKLSPTGTSYLYSTYYGKEGNESFNGVTVDAGGSVYCVGTTNSSTFQTVPTPSSGPGGNPNRRPYDRTFNGGNTDAVMVKFLDNDGGVAFSTYFGGAGDDEGIGIFVDALSRAYGIGTTTSTDLPSSAGFQPVRAGGKDVMWFGISADGRELEGCTYFGGSGDENVIAVRREASNNAVVVGSTTSNDFKLQGAGAIEVRRGNNDGFITEFNLSSIVQSTLIEGNNLDAVSCVDIDAVGDYYFGVTTNSANFEPINRSNTQAAGGGTSDVYAGKWAKGTLELASPSGGELYCLGKPVNIAWGTLDIADSVKYRIEMSADNGATWSTLDSNRTGKSYSWQPKPPAGDRLIRVSSTRGHVDFSKSTFEIVAPPTIKTQPTSVSGCAGDSVTLSVEAEGAELVYQWRKGGQNIANAKSATYKIASISSTNVGKYDVVVTGKCTPAVTSTSVDVVETASPVITSQPQTTSVEENKTLVLKVVAQGSGLTYVWKRNGTVVEGQTTATLTIEAIKITDAGDYICEISSKCGKSTTQVATVTVNPASSVSEDEQEGYTLSVSGANPARESTSITLTGSVLTANLVIVNLRGEVVSNYSVVGSDQTTVVVPTSTLASGMYTAIANVGAVTLRVAFVVAQ